MQQNRLLTKLIAFEFFNDIGSSIFSFAINLYILKNTGSALAFSTGMIVIPLVNIAFLPFSGYIIDNFSSKKVIINSFLVAIISLIITVLSLNFVKNFYIILLLIQLFILRVCDVLIQSTLLVILPNITANINLQITNAAIQTTNKITGILGPIVAGILFNILPFILLGICEVTFDLIALSSFLTINISNSLYKNSENTTKPTYSIIESAKYLLHKKYLLGYLDLCLITNIGLACYQIGIPFLTMEKMNFSSVEYGIIESAFSFGAVIGGLFLSTYKKAMNLKSSFRSFSIVGIGILIMASVIFIMHSHYLIYFFLVVASSIMGIGAVISNITMITFLQKLVRTDIQGHIFTLFDTVSTASLPIFTLIFGIYF